MTGQKTYKEYENEKARGKKRYIERVIEEHEAEREIEEYAREEHPTFPEPENKNKLRY